MLGRRVALKTIREEHGQEIHQILPELVHRFMDEVQIAAQLHHPAIPLVHDVGIGPTGVPYYTMRYVQGQTLAQHLDARREGGGGVRASDVGLLITLAEAIAYAHERDVLHRDLKPGNIIVGRFGEVCVIDWGLARATRNENAGTAHVAGPVSVDRQVPLASGGMGSPGFMAPEQRRGEFHPASDVYSLAAILHVMLAGRPPEVADEAGRCDVPRMWGRRGRRLAAICARGLAPLGERYATMGELLADLRAAVESQAPRQAGEGLRHGSGTWQAGGAGVHVTPTPDEEHGPTPTRATLFPGGRVAPPVDALDSSGADATSERLVLVARLGAPAARFLEIDSIAKGGMGSVLLMRDRLLRRLVAVKRLEANAVHALLFRARRRLRQLIEDELRDVVDPDDFDSELARLCSAWQRTAPNLIEQ